jgi:hypothetical protein
MEITLEVGQLIKITDKKLTKKDKLSILNQKILGLLALGYSFKKRKL